MGQLLAVRCKEDQQKDAWTGQKAQQARALLLHAHRKDESSAFGSLPLELVTEILKCVEVPNDWLWDPGDNVVLSNNRRTAKRGPVQSKYQWVNSTSSRPLSPGSRNYFEVLCITSCQSPVPPFFCVSRSVPFLPIPYPGLEWLAQERGSPYTLNLLLCSLHSTELYRVCVLTWVDLHPMSGNVWAVGRGQLLRWRGRKGNHARTLSLKHNSKSSLHAHVLVGGRQLHQNMQVLSPPQMGPLLWWQTVFQRQEDYFSHQSICIWKAQHRGCLCGHEGGPHLLLQGRQAAHGLLSWPKVTHCSNSALSMPLLGRRFLRCHADSVSPSAFQDHSRIQVFLLALIAKLEECELFLSLFLSLSLCDSFIQTQCAWHYELGEKEHKCIKKSKCINCMLGISKYFK